MAFLPRHSSVFPSIAARAYHGVLAPASPLRDALVPRPAARKEHELAEGQSGGMSPGCPVVGAGHLSRENYIPWAELLRRVFGENVLRCPHCRGRRHLISIITDPEVVGRVLASVRDGPARKRSPPHSQRDGGERQPQGELRIPMPPSQGRLDFGV